MKVNCIMDSVERWELCGYCEFGYRMFMTETGVVKRFPIPLIEVY